MVLGNNSFICLRRYVCPSPYNLFRRKHKEQLSYQTFHSLQGQRFVCISIGKFVINYDEESDIPDVEHLYS